MEMSDRQLGSLLRINGAKGFAAREFEIDHTACLNMSLGSQEQGLSRMVVRMVLLKVSNDGEDGARKVASGGEDQEPKDRCGNPILRCGGIKAFWWDRCPPGSNVDLRDFFEIEPENQAPKWGAWHPPMSFFWLYPEEPERVPISLSFRKPFF